MKPHDNTALSALIQKGYSNDQIRAVLGPLTPDRIYNCRKRLGMGIRDRRRTKHGDGPAEPTSVPRVVAKEVRRCPKCNGCLNTRNGYPIPVEWSCLSCGLTSESGQFCDAANNRRVEL